MTVDMAQMRQPFTAENALDFLLSKSVIYCNSALPMLIETDSLSYQEID